MVRAGHVTMARDPQRSLQMHPEAGRSFQRGVNRHRVAGLGDVRAPVTAVVFPCRRRVEI
jgi:hypothetical protein